MIECVTPTHIDFDREWLTDVITAKLLEQFPLLQMYRESIVIYTHGSGGYIQWSPVPDKHYGYDEE